MKNNYPIKYAVIPIIKQVGRVYGVYGLERNYDIVYYIASKCYVVEENKIYNIDGTITTKYQVVCPYKEKNNDTWYRDEPSFNYMNGQCINSLTVDSLFNSYEEAKTIKNQKNNELETQKLTNVPVSELEQKYKVIRAEFEKKASYYNQLEIKMEDYLQDLNRNIKPKEQSILQLVETKYQKINSSLYDMINIFHKDNYIVYSLPVEEFSKMQYLSASNISNKEYNHTPLLINNGNLDTVKVLSPNNEEKYIVKNKIENGTNISFIIPNYYKYVFYTLEEYEDIIKSFKGNHNNKIQLIKKQ